MRPMKRSGRTLSAPAGEASRPPRTPAAMIATAPSVGTSATAPGKAMPASKVKAATTTAAAPSQPIGPTIPRGSLAMVGAASASRPPAASSKARVGSE